MRSNVLESYPISAVSYLRSDTMDTSAGRSQTWLMADGAASISASMLVAVLLNVVPSFAGLWGLGFLQELTNKQDGMIVVATLLLLPTSFAVYGVSQVIFAAKEAVEKRAMEKGRRAGIQEGRQEGEQTERERIEKGLAELEESGLRIPPEVAELVARESAASPRTRIVSRRRGNRRGSQR